MFETILTPTIIITLVFAVFLYLIRNNMRNFRSKSVKIFMTILLLWLFSFTSFSVLYVLNNYNIRYYKPFTEYTEIKPLKYSQILNLEFYEFILYYHNGDKNKVYMYIEKEVEFEKRHLDLFIYNEDGDQVFSYLLENNRKIQNKVLSDFLKNNEEEWEKLKE